MGMGKVIELNGRKGKRFEPMKSLSKQMTTALSLASLVVVVVVVNDLLPQSTDQSSTGGRALASVNSTISENSSLEWEHRLAEELAKGDERIPASLRSRPNEAQRLAFGYLEGKYSLAYVDGKVSEIQFTDSENNTHRPKQMLDPEEFLNSYKTVWATNFERAVQRSNQEVSGKLVQIYDLLNVDNGVSASAEVTRDKDGRLLKLRIIK